MAEGEEKMEKEITYCATSVKSGATSGRFSEMSERRKRCLRKKKKSSRTCFGKPEWSCETDPHWRIFMQIYVDDLKKKEEQQKEIYGDFYRPKYKSNEIPFIPSVCIPSATPTAPACTKLNIFNREEQLDDLQARIWRNMRDPRACIKPTLSFSFDENVEWPKLWPCRERDVVRERKILLRKLKMKQQGALPCEIEAVDSPGTSDDEDLQEMAVLKELGHARIPLTQPKKRIIKMVDRASGENPGLVSGDYLIYHFYYKKSCRTYVNVCLRGLIGMHLAELHRAREKTWKFDLFQALVALLAKTQFRYKYLWSANIDYIYQHAWMLFLHLGCLAVQKNQRFDDVLVYNYKYSVELELLQELKDVAAPADVSFNYMEKSLTTKKEQIRKEMTIDKEFFGYEKTKDKYKLPVHRGTRKLEKWFEKLELNYTNCIYRTPKFCLAFWQDGSFWYLYNPYRCDKFGFFRNTGGAACIVKFCTRESLRRYLMLLTLKAYAYVGSRDEELESDPDAGDTTCATSVYGFEECFTVQIYQLIYHCCEIHNVKLFTRTPKRPKAEMVEKKDPDPCTFDAIGHLKPKTCEEEEAEKDKIDDLSDKVEISKWTQNIKIPWSKIPEKDQCGNQVSKWEQKWHNYYIIEPRRLYVLFGDIHITDRIFNEENRGRQTGCCYAVCAGMTLINTPEYWSVDVLNAIVVCGDKLYSQRKRKNRKQVTPRTPLDCIDDDNWDEHDRDTFQIDEYKFEFRAKPAIQGRLFVNNKNCLWRTLETFFKNNRFATLRCESTRLGLFKHCGAYYILDVRSHGPPIFERGMGSAYLIRSTCLFDLIKSLVMFIGSPECSKFLLRPIEIVKATDMGEECGKIVCKEIKCPVKSDVIKLPCPFEDDKNKKKKPIDRKPNFDMDDPKKDVDRTTCTQKEG